MLLRALVRKYPLEPLPLKNFGCLPTSGAAGSGNNRIFSFLRNLSPAFQWLTVFHTASKTCGGSVFCIFANTCYSLLILNALVVVQCLSGFVDFHVNYGERRMESSFLLFPDECPWVALGF